MVVVVVLFLVCSSSLIPRSPACFLIDDVLPTFHPTWQSTPFRLPAPSELPSEYGFDAAAQRPQSSLE